MLLLMSFQIFCFFILPPSTHVILWGDLGKGGRPALGHQHLNFDIRKKLLSYLNHHRIFCPSQASLKLFQGHCYIIMLLIINVIIVTNVYKHLTFYYKVYIFYFKKNDYFRLSKPSEFWKLCVGGDKSEFLKYQNYVKEQYSLNCVP